jgi:protein associated with RNAse G/E
MCLQIGDRVLVQGYKADGTLYRWWWATVESAAADEVVTVTPPGHRVEDPAGGWTSRYAIRSYYWPGKWYNLLEVYVPDAGPPDAGPPDAGGPGDGLRLVEIYVNINSPSEIGEEEIRFTDYELDVSRELPGRARIVDEDEFEEAAARYGYTEEFQRFCYEVAREAVGIANGWPAGDMPTFGDSESNLE